MRSNGSLPPVAFAGTLRHIASNAGECPSLSIRYGQMEINKFFVDVSFCFIVQQHSSASIYGIILICVAGPGNCKAVFQQQKTGELLARKRHDDCEIALDELACRIHPRCQLTEDNRRGVACQDVLDVELFTGQQGLRMRDEIGQRLGAASFAYPGQGAGLARHIPSEVGRAQGRHLVRTGIRAQLRQELLGQM